jgi:hypothetical protein
VEVTVERFLSASGELCIVLKRVGTTALILRTAHTLAPYVVPAEHVKGASVWWQGRYFEDIDNALAYFNKEVGESACTEKAAMSVGADGGGKSKLSHLYYMGRK